MENSKALVEIVVPSISRTFDVYIPLYCKACDATNLISKAVEELTKGFFVGNKETVLCDYKTGDILNTNLYINELGIKNGSKLLLI